MARNISDQMGRALEYAIVNYFINNKMGIVQVGATMHDQVREKPKFEGLDSITQNRYERSAQEIFDWTDKEWSIRNADTTTIERLPDSAAKKGDVTDIRLVIDGETHNLSIKHNHTALKHQRPAALPQQCGFARKSKEDVEYRNRYKELTEEFAESVADDFPGNTTFKEVKENDDDYINKNLYAPVCKLNTKFLTENCVNNQHAQDFFSFLVGMTDYYKIIVYSNHIEIMEFAEMPPVKNLYAEHVSDSNIHIDFLNGWEISMRLHTASSSIEGVSLKFDTQPLNIDVDTEKIDL